MYRHIFWDMGGTLVDTYPQLDATFAEVVRGRGHEVSIEHVASLTRESTAHAIRTLADEFEIEPSAFEAANAALKKAWRLDPAPVMPGAPELMEKVRAAGGLNLVVTHRDRISADALVRALGLHIDDLVSASDGFPRKPAPDMHLSLVEKHTLDVDECLAIGDRPIDAAAAAAAGMDAVLLTSPFADRAAGVRTVASLSELMEEVAS